MPNPLPDPQASRAWLDRALIWVPAVVAVVAVAVFVVVALYRLTYPFALEWLEGACVVAVGRILDGQPLYTPPSVDYIPFLYTPLYFYASAGAAKLLGLGFTPLRLISLLASFGSLLLLFCWVRRETGRVSAGLLAAGLFAACYRAGGAWLDLGRVDALFLFWLLLAAFGMRFARTLPEEAGTALAAVLAILTKQAAAFALAPLLLFLPWWRRPRGWLLATACVIMTALSLWLLDLGSHGWFRYYVFDLPRRHMPMPGPWWSFWQHDLAGVLPWALAAALAGLWFRFRQDRVSGWFYACLLAGFLGAAWEFRRHPGGYDNVLLPAYAAIALLAGLAWGRLAAALARPKARRRWLAAGAVLLCLHQFWLLRYDPRAQIPTAADRAAGEKLVARLAAEPGEIFSPWADYLPMLAGKRPLAHLGSLDDLLYKAKPDAVTERLRMEFRQALQMGRFALVLAPAGDFQDGAWHLQRHKLWLNPEPYARAEAWLDPGEDVFWPVTGARRRPDTALRFGPARQR